MGVEPIFIQSSLVSAQSRQRYYWTNIPNVTPPEERGIVLRDILEDYPNENPVKHTERNARHLKQLDEKSLCMTATMYKGAGNNGMTLVPQHIGTEVDIKGHDQIKRVYSPDGKSPTLMAGNSGGGKEPVKINDDMYWRKLTPLECERLQTVPDNYTNHVSNTQRYKMLGNGWTIEVIAHIFKNMGVDNV